MDLCLIDVVCLFVDELMLIGELVVVEKYMCMLDMMVVVLGDWLNMVYKGMLVVYG